MIITGVADQSQQWKELRSNNIGASEIAILFGHQSFESLFSLWHKKAKLIPDDYEDNINTLCGKYMEDWIAEQVGKQMNWNVQPFDGYAVHDTVKGIGSTPDRQIIFEDGDKWILEVKNVGTGKYYEEWANGKPQFAHQLQVMHQLSTLQNDGFSRAVIGAWVCGERLSITEYDLRPKTVAIIESKVREFWQSVENNAPPCPDAHRTTREALDKIYAMNQPEVLDFVNDEEMPELCERYMEAEFIKKNSNEEFDECKNKLHEKMGIGKKLEEGFKAYAQGYKISVFKNRRIVIKEITDYGT